MTLDCSPETVEGAQSRGGDPATDRPDRIEQALNRPEVGYGEGEPLVANRYSQYPDKPEQLTEPKWGSLVEDLLAHPLVRGYSSAVDELTTAQDGERDKWRESVAAAASAYDLDAPELFERGAGQSREDPLVAILGYQPSEDMTDSPLLVGELYCLGLGVSEICQVLEDREGAQVRDALKDLGLLQGRTQEQEREDASDRLGGTTMDFRESGDVNPGVNINSEAVAEDPNISVERGDQ
jgi:hypothetical protein